MKNKFNLKKEYEKSWNYIKKSQKFIWIIVSLFFLTAILGYFIPAPESLSNEITKIIEEILEKTKNLSHLGLIRFIFLNNLQASFIGIITGLFFGIFPVMFTIVNGYILGYVGKLSVEQNGALSLLNLLPHGIFELPAVFISFGLGLKFATWIASKNPKKEIKELSINLLRVFLTIVLPLLIIAGIIEGTLIFLAK